MRRLIDFRSEWTIEKLLLKISNFGGIMECLKQKCLYIELDFPSRFESGVETYLKIIYKCGENFKQNY